jgi:hypothetical protein
MIDVTVKVDEGRLADFYAMYAEWLKSGSEEAQANEGTLADWEPGDVREASYVWRNMHPRARTLFEILLAASEPVQGSELARALGPDAREDTVFGTFGPPAKLAKEVGHKHMIKSQHGPTGNSYWLEPAVKAAFEAARRDPS